jgi:hypothetical protein
MEFANSTFNLAAVQSRLMDVVNAILATDASTAAHCCLALVAIVSFSLRMKQLRRQNPKDSGSIQLLVANLFTVGCSGVGDSGDILHSVCNASIFSSILFHFFLCFNFTIPSSIFQFSTRKTSK